MDPSSVILLITLSPSIPVREGKKYLSFVSTLNVAAQLQENSYQRSRAILVRFGSSYFGAFVATTVVRGALLQAS
jgi:hypothetical protein